jgi:hypothetical protein
MHGIGSFKTAARFGVEITFLLICMMALPLFAQAPPSADTFVSSAFPKGNYGSGVNLALSPGATSYVRFNLSGIPSNATISKASLRLYVDAVSKPGSFDVYQLNSGWSEHTLTFNTPPPPLGASATGGHPAAVTSASCNQFLLIDITALAQGWINGTIPNNGVALALTSAAGTFFFDSKESLFTGNGPELEVVFSAQGPAGPQGPQGIQGPQGLQGNAGMPGIDGATGPQGPAGTNGTSFIFRGEFSNDVTYAINDVVSYNGSSYIATIANQREDAPGTNAIWSLMAQAGAPGAQGAQGAQGAPGADGARGLTGAPGLPGAQGPPGVQGSPGIQGPQGPGGFSGMQQFANATNVPFAISVWTAPAGVTHVMVEMWGGGGGLSVNDLGSQGASYSREVLQVTPGSNYVIQVGGGGLSVVDFTFEHGHASSISGPSGQKLMFADGGGTTGFPAVVDPSAAISHVGLQGPLDNGGFAYGASFCPNGPLTGKGGDLNMIAQPGYVLLVW